MAYRMCVGLIAAALLVGFIAPYVLKLQAVALVIVAGLGVAMMLIDLWQTLRSHNDR